MTATGGFVRHRRFCPSQTVLLTGTACSPPVTDGFVKGEGGGHKEKYVRILL